MPKSVPYHDHLMEFLRNPEASAAYIEAILEEKDPEPNLFKRALSNVLEALGESKMSKEDAKLHLEKLNEVMSKQGSDAIYNLGEWLNALGLKLTVTVMEPSPESSENAEIAEVTSG